MSKDIIQDLEKLIESGLAKAILPYSRGNIIQLKNYVIKKNGFYYDLIDVEKNRTISKLNFKRSAIALAKCLIHGIQKKNEIEVIDRDLVSSYNDILFFENTLKTSKDSVTRSSRRARLELALQKATFAKQKLDKFIF